MCQIPIEHEKLARHEKRFWVETVCQATAFSDNLSLIRIIQYIILYYFYASKTKGWI